MGSRLPSFFHSSYDSSPLKLSTMEAIRKKMQAMKVEKDNACDRVDASEEQCKAARLRASKAEDEVDELVTKSRQLETELDLTTEKLGIATLQLEEKEKQLSATELEMAALNRRGSGLEEDLEKAEAADNNYDEVAKKLATCESELEKAEERADVGETKTLKLEQAEARAEFAEKSVQKLQKEVDRLEDELVSEQEKYKAITEELEQTFAEMSGY